MLSQRKDTFRIYQYKYNKYKLTCFHRSKEKLHVCFLYVLPMYTSCAACLSFLRNQYTLIEPLQVHTNGWRCEETVSFIQGRHMFRQWTLPFRNCFFIRGQLVLPCLFLLLWVLYLFSFQLIWKACQILCVFPFVIFWISVCCVCNWHCPSCCAVFLTSLYNSEANSS